MVSEAMQTSAEEIFSKILRENRYVIEDFYRFGARLKGTSSEERSSLVRKIDELYSSDPLTALRLTAYGRIHELGLRIDQLLNNTEQPIIYLAIDAARRLKTYSSYNILLTLLKRNKKTSLEGNILLALSGINFKETLHFLKEYLERTNENESRFIISNVLYDLIADKRYEEIDQLSRTMNKRKKGFQIFLNSYKDALKSIETEQKLYQNGG